MGDRTTTRYDETIRLPCEPRAARTARAFVDGALGQRGWADLDRELAKLVTSELVANAVLYAPGRLAVRCVVDDDLRIEVVDGHPDALVHPARRGPAEIGGLGLQLVSQVAQAWGVDRGWASKTVWCLVERRGLTAGDRLPSLAD